MLSQRTNLQGGMASAACEQTLLHRASKLLPWFYLVSSTVRCPTLVPITREHPLYLPEAYTATPQQYWPMETWGDGPGPDNQYGAAPASAQKSHGGEKLREGMSKQLENPKGELNYLASQLQLIARVEQRPQDLELNIRDSSKRHSFIVLQLEWGWRVS